MRLVIYFYIVLGLFKLFKGLTHGVHSNSAREWETKVKGTSQWSWTMGKGWIFAAIFGSDASHLYYTFLMYLMHRRNEIQHKRVVFSHDAVRDFRDIWINKFLLLWLFCSLLQKSCSFSAVVGTGFLVSEDRNLGRVEHSGVTLRAGPFPGALLDQGPGFRAVFLINLLPAVLGSPSTRRLLYRVLFLCVSHWYRGTWAVAWNILEKKISHGASC